MAQTIKQNLPPVGDLVVDSYEYLKTNWKKLLEVVLTSIVYLILLTLVFASFDIFFGATEIFPGFFASDASDIVFQILNYVVLAWFGIVLTNLIAKEEYEKTTTTLYKEAKNYFIPYVWVNIIIAVITTVFIWFAYEIVIASQVFMAGDLALFGYLMGAVFVCAAAAAGVYFMYGPIVTVLEGVKGHNALKRSQKLVGEYFWPVVLRIIVLGALSVIFTVFSALISWVLVFIPYVGGILNFIFIVLTTAIILVYVFVYQLAIYKQLKERKG